ncbi:hypothetical protein CEE45_17300 [Candidatus Heimdallarchaeota archaeon B3_Heim]|nr:MAG: hypothetical protein CEE45_17300 [Candidatus Heimdallarchaeota archaeon B3_Heim]
MSEFLEKDYPHTIVSIEPDTSEEPITKIYMKNAYGKTVLHLVDETPYAPDFNEKTEYMEKLAKETGMETFGIYPD